LAWRVKFTKEASKEFKKIDKGFQKIILKYLKTRVQPFEDPRQFGKGLVGNKSGLWRYRVGDYRIISQIKDEEVLILIIQVGHRKGVYK